MPGVSSKSILRIISFLGCALCLFCARPAEAQQAAPATVNQDDINKQLMDRIRDLETEVQALKEKPQASAPAPAAPPAVVETPPQNQVAERLQMRVFGDLGYRASDEKGNANSFISDLSIYS